MDKNKSEKLKEILNQTISQEEIEEKLKKEIKASAVKKAEEKKKAQEEALENKNLNEKEEIEKDIEENKKNEEKKEEVIIPSVRNEKKESKNINLILYIVAAIALLLLLVTIFLFTKSNDSIQKEPFKTTNIQSILEKTANKVENQILEKKVEDKATKAIENNLEKAVEIKEDVNKEKEKLVKIEEVKPKEIIKEVIKEKIVTKVVKLDKKNFKEYYNSSKYNTLKCYDFKAGNVFPTSTCKKNLAKFLKENNKAIRFEVIPVIAEDDNIIFDKLQTNIKNMDKAFQEKVKEYMFRGLSRERVLESSWHIKDTLGENTILTPTNYYVKSKKNNKGIIIKAYH